MYTLRIPKEVKLYIWGSDWEESQCLIHTQYCSVKWAVHGGVSRPSMHESSMHVVPECMKTCMNHQCILNARDMHESLMHVVPECMRHAWIINAYWMQETCMNHQCMLYLNAWDRHESWMHVVPECMRHAWIVNAYTVPECMRQTHESWIYIYGCSHSFGMHESWMHACMHECMYESWMHECSHSLCMHEWIRLRLSRILNGNYNYIWELNAGRQASSWLMNCTHLSSPVLYGPAWHVTITPPPSTNQALASSLVQLGCLNLPGLERFLTRTWRISILTNGRLRHDKKVVTKGSWVQFLDQSRGIGNNISHACAQRLRSFWGFSG